MEETDVIEMEHEEAIDDAELMEQPVEARVVKYSITMAKIAKLQEKYREVPADLSVKANYEIVRKGAAELRGYRTDVEKRRKELKADALAWGKKVDAAAKELTEKLLAIEEPLATAKKEFDTAEEIKKREAALAEEKRVDGIAERIAGIKAMVEANISSPSAIIEGVIASIQNDPDPTNIWAMEFSDKAEEAIKTTVAKLEELRAMKFQQETFAAEQAKAEEARKIKEEEDRKKREEEVEAERAKLAAEREAMEAEKARMATEQKIKDDAAKAELEAERAKLAAEKAEADRIQKEKDDAIAARMAEMAAEVERLRRPVVETVEVVAETVVEAVETVQNVAENIVNHLAAQVEQEVTAQVTASATHDSKTDSEVLVDDYKAAGRAMIRFIGNREVTKNLLDAIIIGEIPNVLFTGSK